MSGSTLVVGAAVVSGSNPTTGYTQAATATCALGMVLLSGGGSVTSGQADRVQLTGSYPSSTTTWTAVGTVNLNMTQTNTMTTQAFALCTS